jgi:hypothetical protein
MKLSRQVLASVVNQVAWRGSQATFPACRARRDVKKRASQRGIELQTRRKLDEEWTELRTQVEFDQESFERSCGVLQAQHVRCLPRNLHRETEI